MDRTRALRLLAAIIFGILPGAYANPVAETSTLSFSQGPDYGTYSIGQVEIPLTALGGSQPYTWKIVSGSLPPGMALRKDPDTWFPASASAGLVGIATTAGAYRFTVQVTSGSQSATQDDTLEVTSLCVQDLYNLPDAFLNTPYSYSLTALNATGPVKWAPTSKLPPGLELVSTGVLTGTPTAVGNYSISFSLTSGTTTVYRSVSLNVYAIEIPTSAILPNAKQNTPFKTSIQAKGGSGTYTFSASGLPAGLSMNSSGLISGTPAGGPGRTGIVVTATDSEHHFYSKPMTIDIVATPPALPYLSPYSPGEFFDDCTIGVQCGNGVNAESGGTAPFAWTATGLPPGMTVHSTSHGATDSWITPGDAELWGTPTAAGEYSVKITVTDATGVSTTNTFPLRVSRLQLSTGLANGKLAVPYSSKLRVLGGSSEYSLKASGYAPSGLGLNDSSFSVSGTPSESGTDFFETLQFADTAGNALTLNDYFSIAGAGSGAVQIDSYYQLGGGWVVGSAYTNQISVCCAPGYLWSVVAGKLPPGINLTSNGELTGKLTTAGNFVFSIKAADSSNPTNYAVQQFNLGVTPLSPSEYYLPYGDLHVPYGTQLTASGGKGDLTWKLLPGYDLPPGLSLASNGTISGTPTESGQYLFELSLADQAGHSSLNYFDLSIYPPSFYTIDSVKTSCNASLVYFTGTDQCTATVEGTGFFTNVVQWSSSAGSISDSGLISPSGATGTIIITAASAADLSKSASARVTSTSIVNPVPAISSFYPKSATAGGKAFTLTVGGTDFVPGAQIQWNGNTRTTSFIDKTRLTSNITAADIASGQKAVITVLNPPLGGGASAEAPFVVVTPVPSGVSILPSSASAGGDGFTLTVDGSNFLPGSTIQWNGSYGQPPLSTFYVSSTQLKAAIPASDIAFAGRALVTVVNPSPGGGTSAAAIFTIDGSIPENVSFVAPHGSDTNPGTFAEPYLTIQKCATTVSSGAICAIRAGTYRETVTPNSGITITSYDGEPVIVDGSDPVTGWSIYKGSIYKASVALSAGDTNQIFVGGQMMTEARWPNGNDLFHVNWATAGAGTTTTELVDPNLPHIDWTGAKIHIWSGIDAWDPQTGTVTTSSLGQLDFIPDGADYPPQIQVQAGGYYYLYRILGALDAPGEWYYDPTEAVLYFWAPDNGNPTSLDVSAKRRQYAFDLSGRSNVTIQYVNLIASAINMSASSAKDTLNGINAQYLSQFTDLPDEPGYPHSYWYDQTSTSGIVIDGTGNLLENSTIAFSAGNGVALSGSNNTIRNNLIRFVDYAANCGSGITLTFQAGGGNEIQNNTIGSVARFGLDYLAGTSEDISYNNFFDAMMVSRDGGQIYLGGLSAAGTKIHNNWFHDTETHYPGLAYFSAGMSGVYLDEDSGGLEVDQNIFWNNQFDTIFLNYSSDGGTAPNDNYVHNNTIPDINSTGEIYTDLNTPCGTTRIVDNRELVPIFQQGTICEASDNNPSAPGATEMTLGVKVGCNFAGCASEAPPAISGTSVAASIAVQPYDIAVATGQPVTFTVTGAGSATLTYQWQRNGADITGATGPSYTLQKPSSVDNGAVFTVIVSNSLGKVASNPATLTVN